MRHSTLEVNLQEPIDVKWNATEFDAEMIAIDAKNGILGPGGIAHLLKWEGAIHSHANAAGIEEQPFTVASEHLQVGMATRQNLARLFSKDGIQLLIRRGGQDDLAE